MLVHNLRTFAFLPLEKLIEAYRDSGMAGQAISDVLEHRNRYVMLAKALGVGLALNRPPPRRKYALSADYGKPG
jgi:hypothetical protein